MNYKEQFHSFVWKHLPVTEGSTYTEVTLATASFSMTIFSFDQERLVAYLKMTAMVRVFPVTAALQMTATVLPTRR